jgi:hypothetical protein
MRATIDIDDDVLAAAKELARAEGRIMEQVISVLARNALTQPGLMTGMDETQVTYMAEWPTIFQRFRFSSVSIAR